MDSNLDIRAIRNSEEKDLYKADLRGADLKGAYLRSADLSGADLTDAYLRDANLRGADLRGADLKGAYLRDANLTDADLSDADLSDAYLGGANIRGADLTDANLRGTNLTDANLSDAEFDQHEIPDGELTVYKHLKDSLCRLKIPEDADRVQSLNSSKCRAEYAIVEEILSTDGSKTNMSSDESPYYDTKYIEGERIEPDSFDDDVRVSCTYGIHFYLTEKEAIENATW